MNSSSITVGFGSREAIAKDCQPDEIVGIESTRFWRDALQGPQWVLPIGLRIRPASMPQPARWKRALRSAAGSRRQG